MCRQYDKVKKKTYTTIKMDKEKINKNYLEKIVHGKWNTRIIAVLEKVKTITVNDLSKYVGIDQPTTSLILKNFKALKIVHCKVDGKFRRYSLNKKVYDKIVKTYTEIEIREREAIDKLFENIDTKERDPFIYKQKIN